MILFAVSLLLFSKAGLLGRPNSIAAVASLMRHPRVRADMSELPVNASAQDMQRLMAGKRYRLGHYNYANELVEYGIYLCSGEIYGPQYGDGRQHQYASVDGSLNRKGSRARGVQLNLWVLAVCLVDTLGVILLYHPDVSDSSFNRFFNSNTFGPRFVLTQPATIIASVWKSVEQGKCLFAHADYQG